MKRRCSLPMFLLVLGILLHGTDGSAEVKAFKVTDPRSFTNVPQESVYESATLTVSIDPAATNWIALSYYDNLVQSPTGDNGNIPFSGTPQINQLGVDDYAVVTVSKGSAVSSAIALDNNDAGNCRIGNQAVISGSYPAVRAVDCVDWSKTPPVVRSANFAESGQLTDFFKANGKGDYTFKLDFKNKYTGAAGHGAVWLLMDVRATTQGLPVPAGQQAWGYPAVETCLKSLDPAAARPLSVGAVATGASTLTIRVETEKFTAPVDLYFGLYCRAIDPANIYLLTQNGLRPLSQGLAPWRTGVSGPLSENISGDVPTAALRPGSCELYLAATPAGRKDRFYVWGTSFMVKPLPAHVVDGRADFFDGTVVIPNAEILSQGQYHDQMASVPPKTLVGVMRGGKVYLYHTSMGNVPLSDETTRKAIGRFVMDFPSASAPASAVSSLAGPESLNMDSPLRLKSGVVLTREGQQTVLASNGLRRWAAVKGTDGTGPVFLPPLGRYVDDNVLRMIGTQVAKHFNPSQTWFNANNSNEESLTFSTNTLTIETYGAVWRPLPYLLEGATDIGNAVAELFGGRPNPATGIEIDGLALRDQKDALLGDTLDTVDLSYMIFEGLKAFVSFADFTELIEPACTAAFNFALHITDSWASGKTGSPQSEAALRGLVEDFINDLISAGVNVKTLGTATPILSLIDGLNALDYIIEGVVLHDAEVVGTWAYDEVPMEGGGQTAVDLFSSSWKLYTSCDAGTTNCYPIPRNMRFLRDGTYEFLDSGMTKVTARGNWTLQGSALTLTPTQGDCTATYQGTVEASYQADKPLYDVKGFSILGPQCANPGEKGYWWLTK